MNSLKPVDAQFYNPKGFDLLYYKIENEKLMVYNPKNNEWEFTPLNQQIVQCYFERI